MPAADETGDFIAPEAINRHHVNIKHARNHSRSKHVVHSK